MKGLENKVAIVTGAAAGIGRAIAHRLTQEGAIVVYVDIDEEALTRAAPAHAHATCPTRAPHMHVRAAPCTHLFAYGGAALCTM